MIGVLCRDAHKLHTTVFMLRVCLSAVASRVRANDL